jgi:hypothetical protein
VLINVQTLSWVHNVHVGNLSYFGKRHTRSRSRQKDLGDLDCCPLCMIFTLPYMAGIRGLDLQEHQISKQVKIHSGSFCMLQVSGAHFE